MTRSPDSLIPSDSGQPAPEKRDDKAFKCRQEGEANLRAATQVNAVSASSTPPGVGRLNWIPSRGEPVSSRRSLPRFGVQREWNRIAGTVYRAAARRESPSS